MDVFETACSYYINYGMTYEQFWDGDVSMHKHYRAAYKHKLEDQDYLAWNQGAYVYRAIVAVSPILRAFSKARKPEEYLEKPFSMQSAENIAKKKREQREQDRQMRKAKTAFEIFMVNYNSRFEAKSLDGKEGVGVASDSTRN